MANFQKHKKNVNGLTLDAPDATSYELGLHGPVDLRNNKELTVSAFSFPSVIATPGKMLGTDVRLWKLSKLPPDRILLVAKDDGGLIWTTVTIDTRPVADRSMKIVVDLGSQTLEAIEDGKRKFIFDCVTGDQGHPTDKGTFKITLKHRIHRSKKYDVQMNFAMFFTADGKAIHQYHGVAPLSLVRTLKSGSDFFGSHGCVRLTEDDATKLFEWAPVQTTVVIK